MQSSRRLWVGQYPVVLCGYLGGTASVWPMSFWWPMPNTLSTRRKEFAVTARMAAPRILLSGTTSDWVSTVSTLVQSRFMLCPCPCPCPCPCALIFAASITSPQSKIIQRNQNARKHDQPAGQFNQYGFHRRRHLYMGAPQIFCSNLLAERNSRSDKAGPI